MRDDERRAPVEDGDHRRPGARRGHDEGSSTTRGRLEARRARRRRPPPSRGRRRTRRRRSSTVAITRCRARARAAPRSPARPSARTRAQSSAATRRSGTRAPGRRSIQSDQKPRSVRLVQPLVEQEAGAPRRRAPGPHERPLEEVRARVRHPAQQPVRRQHAEQRDEHGAEQQQEPLVAGACRSRARRWSPRSRRRRSVDRCRTRVRMFCKRDGGRVLVRERLVRLVHGQREQRDRRGGASARDRHEDQLRPVRGRSRARAPKSSRARTGTGSGSGSRSRLPRRRCASFEKRV